MYCPNCNAENNDSAKFCKKCGTPLKKKTISHESMINTINNEKSSGNDKTKYIIVALIIVAVVLAGVFAYLGLSNSDSGDTQAVDNTPQQVQNTTTQQSTQASQPAQTAASPQTTAMTIGGGSFTTGSSLSDKTYASIYVGPEHAGENIKIQILYSRDGSALNDGNMVPKTVGSDGYIEVASADSYKYYPDYATINIYDTSGNLLTTQSVSLSPESGTQSF